MLVKKATRGWRWKVTMRELVSAASAATDGCIQSDA